MTNTLLKADIDRPATEFQYVHHFGGGHAEHGAEARDLLGNKGANLCELARMGAPVPPGFVIATDACRFRTRTGTTPAELAGQVRAGIAWIEEQAGLRFGSLETPLLVSVRSGARDSMPGMMDTVLNVGASSAALGGIAQRAAGGRRFALDCRRRLLQMFGHVVLGLDAEAFEDALDGARLRAAVRSDAELSAIDLERVIADFEQIVGDAVPDDPWQQLDSAIAAVFDSWMGDRARVYREHHGIPHDWGTAVTVQAMAFGNTGPSSASGVVFTRDPATGSPEAFGEYLVDAQGEDVVSGSRTPQLIPAKGDHSDPVFGAAFAELHAWLDRLEQHYRDMQDVEFTIEDGSLWLLQTRTAKRSPDAAVRIAVELVESGTIDRDEALLRIPCSVLEQLQTVRLAHEPVEAPLVTGLPASPGVAVGRVAFDVDAALKLVDAGDPVVLMRVETSSSDVEGMLASAAVVTARGGMTSHAAVVARGIALPCVSGCSDLVVHSDTRTAIADTAEIAEGDWVTVDATGGRVYPGSLAVAPAQQPEALSTILVWADERRELEVRANADTPADAIRAREAGAAGIGLCRTEHMFFQPERLVDFVGMLLAADEHERQVRLARLRDLQHADFAAIFEAMDGHPVTIRLLDPPLHEFLPRTEEQLAKLAVQLNHTPAELRASIEHLAENNPMLGTRGIRLALMHPHIYEMQVAAIAEAIVSTGTDPNHIAIMLPLVMNSAELRSGVRIVRRILAANLDEQSAHAVRVGTMVELPRACVTASDLARHCDFFSFGTNDLTQTTLGLSRDDTSELISTYLHHGILAHDPFATIDRDGVGQLVAQAASAARHQDPSFELGACGEHAGDPSSIRFFDELALTYVSCSAPRVQVARLAAAHAAIERGAAT